MLKKIKFNFQEPFFFSNKKGRKQRKRRLVDPNIVHSDLRIYRISLLT